MLEYLEADRTWGTRYAGVLRPHPVAYFSAEFGLHESLPIYSGGLGVLAGDHIKSSSDLDIPLVGIGLFYPQGYFRQHLDIRGWQHEEYLETDVNQLPMEAAIGRDGRPVLISIDTRSGSIQAISICSIPMWKAMLPKTANSPPGSTGAISGSESARNYCSVSEACAPLRPLEFLPAFFT
jgi:glucan phosphorylase